MPEYVLKKPHLKLRFLTPHGKWGIHSSYQDTLRMLTLFRGGPHIWISELDAQQAGIKDNYWLELVNSNGTSVCRAVVSHRIARGVSVMHHSQEKNVNVPGSPTTGKRAGTHNALTRVIIKSTNMVGGYVQLAYSFNYYGTVGCNRDTEIIVHKLEDQDIEWLEGPLTPEIEAQRNPAGVGPR